MHAPEESLLPARHEDAHTGLLAPAGCRGAAALDDAIHFDFLESGLGQPPADLIAIKPQPAVVLLRTEELERAPIQIRDDNPSPGVSTRAISSTAFDGAST